MEVLHTISKAIDAIPVIGQVLLAVLGLVGTFKVVPKKATETAKRLAEVEPEKITTAIDLLSSGKDGRHEYAVDKIADKYGIPVDAAETIVSDVEKVYKKTIGQAIKAIRK